MGNYYLSVGGTGHKILESIIHLCAAGLGPEELYVVFFDLDTDNRIFQRTISLLKLYIENRNRIYDDHHGQNLDIYKTKIELPFSLSETNDPSDYSLLQLDSYFNMNQLLKCSDRINGYNDLLSFFYTEEELKESLREGFKGRPYIGSAFIQSLNSRYSLSEGNGENISNPTWLNFINRTRNDNNFKMFVGGSLFGGTGASCFPGIKKLLNNIPTINSLANKRYGSFMTLPYFKFPQMDSNEEGLHIEPSKIDYIAKETLSYYGKNGSDCFDDFYIAGEDNPRREVSSLFKNGRGDQYNRPHHIELFAGLGAMNFYQDDYVPNNTPRIFLMKGNAFIKLTDLPYAKKTTDSPGSENLLDFSLLSGMMLGSSENLACYPWYNKIKSYYEESYLQKFTLPNELLDYFKRFITWFYDMHDFDKNKNYKHKLALMPNIEFYISRTKESDVNADFSFFDSPSGQDDYFYNIYYDNDHLKQLFKNKNLFDEIFRVKPGKISKKTIEGLALQYKDEMDIVVLNVLYEGMKRIKITVLDNQTKCVENPYPFLPKISTTSAIDNIINSPNEWISAGNNAISDIANFLVHGIDTQNIDDIRNERNSMPAIYPVITARPLSFKDKLLKKDTLAVKKWKCLLGVVSLAKYFNYNVKVKRIKFDSLPDVFVDIYRKYLGVKSNTHLYTVIEMVYLNDKPLAIAFPDCLLALIDDPIKVLKGIAWGWDGDEFNLKDPLVWIKSNLNGQDKIEALELLKRWIYNLSNVLENDIKNDWFTDSCDNESRNKSQIVSILSDWKHDIDKASETSAIVVDSTNVNQYNGETFSHELLYSVKDSTIQSDKISKVLFRPVRKLKIDGELNLVSGKIVEADNYIIVTDQWNNNKFKIAGPLYTDRDCYKDIINKKDKNEKSEMKFVFIQDCFTKKIGYGPKFDKKSIYLDISDEISAMLPFEESIFDYFTVEEIYEKVKIKDFLAETEFDEDGMTPNKISISFVVKKDVRSQDGEFVTLSVSKTYFKDDIVRLNFSENQVMIWPDFEHAYWKKYLLIHEVEGKESFKLTPYTQNEQTLDVSKRNNDSFQEIMYTSDRPLNCLKTEFNGIVLGFLGFDYRKKAVISNTSLSYSVDFGTSNTVVFDRTGNLSENNQGMPHKFNKETLHITLLTDVEDSISIVIRRLAPYVLPGEESITQFSTLLYNLEGDNNQPFFDSNVLINEKVIMDRTEILADKNVKDNIKWDNDPKLRDRYLKQLLILLIADGLYNGASEVHFYFAYPQAFTKYMESTYRNSLAKILKDFGNSFVLLPQGYRLLNENDKNSIDKFLFYLENISTESQANINYLSKFPETYAHALNNADGVVNFVIDIGGGSSDMAIVYWKDGSNFCNTSSIEYGGGNFAKCIGKDNSRSLRFIQNLKDSFCSSDGIKSSDTKKINDRIESLSESYKTKPKSTLNLILKKYRPTINHVNNPEEIYYSLYLRTFFSGLIFYAGLLVGALPIKGIESVNIYLCGNGSKLLSLEGISPEKSFEQYFTSGFSINRDNKVNCSINSKVGSTSIKNEVAKGMICEQTYDSDKIGIFSIIGESIKNKDNESWKNQVENFEYNHEQFDNSIFTAYSEILEKDVIDTYGPQNIGNKSIIKILMENIENVSKMLNIETDEIDLGKNKVRRLREPVFISEIKSLLKMY